jgi:hypothetical protein
MYFYSLSTFETVSLQYSDLPLRFFQTITASVPADFFSFLELVRDSDSDAVDVFGPFPLYYYSKFLSTVSSFPISAHDNRTTLSLPYDLGVGELQVILSHHFHRSLILKFDDESPFDGAVSMDDVNDLLRECHVPSLKVPDKLASFCSCRESFAANCCLRSLSLSVADDKTLDEKMLDALSRNRSIEYLEIWFHSSKLPDHTESVEVDGDNSAAAALRGVLRRTFNREFYIKYLALHFAIHEETNPDKLFFAKIFLKIFEPHALPALRELLFFSVSLRGFNAEEEEDPPNWIPREADNVQGIRNWDQDISPWLVLNFYRSKVLEPMRGSLVPLAVQAINWGGVYRQTTPCAPSNMDVANAGLIFRVFRRAACSNTKL